MRDKLLPLLLAVVLLGGCAHQPVKPAQTSTAGDVRRYTVLMSTNAAGKEIVTTSGRDMTIDYEFNDRGRGPKLHTVMQVDEHSIPLAIHTTGNDYFKSPVEERFGIENGIATWKNPSEDSRGDAG
ncbi:MAG: hypothetical protein QOH21_2988, partial [Acidobacteriota bacterium]|nr:hypothetical protein [Acidobacteriota bacterium]